MKLSIVVAVLCLGSSVRAEPDVPDYQTPGRPTPGVPLPPPVANAPPGAGMPEPVQLGEDEEQLGPPPSPVGQPYPGEESGRIDEPERESQGRKLARGLLYLPRAIVTTLLTPVRVGVMFTSKYEIGPRLHRWFYNDADTFGLYPSLAFESGYGFRVGAQMIYRPTPYDRFRAFGGGNFTGERTRFAASYEALDRAGGRLDFGASAEYNKRPDDMFYGFGNTDSLDVVPLMPVALGIDSRAFDAEYRSRLDRATGTADALVLSHIHTRGTVAVADRNRDPSKHDESIFDIYEPMSLVGFNSYRYTYAELEVYWDNRHAVTPWDHAGVTSRGTFASAWAGRMLMEDMRDFWRYGVELQQFIRLADGPRVLSARFHGEAINARVDEIPFTEVPPLGGPYFLRGYPIDRFRDRIAAVGTLEYQWDLAYGMFASLFVDCGRVYSSYDDLSLDDLRTGFGLAFEAHTKGFTAVRLSMASSEAGDIFFNLYFEPIIAVKPRVERR